MAPLGILVSELARDLYAQILGHHDVRLREPKWPLVFDLTLVHLVVFT